MTAYKRFIAYVYEYRKEKKSAGCGFLKIEDRGGQCSIEVHLRCPGLPSHTTCSVYGFVRKDGLINGILLGTCMTKDDILECTIQTDSHNMGGSGIPLEKIGGIIFLTDTGGFLGTEWDDQPIRPANFRELPVRQETTVPDKPETTETPEYRPEMDMDPVLDSDPASDSNPVPDADPVSDSNPVSDYEDRRAENISEDNRSFIPSSDDLPDTRNNILSPERNDRESDFPDSTAADEEQPFSSGFPDVDNSASSNTINNSSRTFLDRYSETNTGDAPLDTAPADNKSSSTYMENNAAGSAPQTPGTPSGLSVNEVPKSSARVSKSESFFPFDDGVFEDCRKIHLCDLGKLSVRNAPLRGNRFLQYGHYNFGHLLLARRADGQYILGVPGGYGQQEHFMANMFGFPYFKESRIINLPNVRGGYWYRLIDPPNFH